jgi:chain length determinant protein EpsF
MTLGQFLTILRARWLAAFLTFAVIVGSTLAVSLLLPKKYEAVAQVIVDVKSPDPIAGIVLPAMLTPGYMATQMDIIRSQNVALRVVDKMGIATNPQAIGQWREATDGGQGSIRHFYADLLLQHLEVEPSRESSVVSIGYTGSDPRFAATVANEFVQAYIDTNIELRVAPARQSAAWFDEQTRLLRANVDAAQSRLTNYQREKGIVSADEQLDVETARLQELSSQVTQLNAIAVESNKRHAMAKEALARGGAGGLPDVIANAFVSQLKANQAQLQGRMKELAATRGSSHPDVLKIQQELEHNAALLAQEIRTVANSLGNTAAVNSQRLTEARDALERQRERVLETKQAREELTVMQRDLENAQRSYDAITQKLTQTSLESQSSQANILLLNRAEPPTEPASPKVWLNGAIAVLLGGLLGMGAALLAEFSRRRVRSLEDVEQAINAPVIGQVREVTRRARKLQGWTRQVAV